MARLNGYRWRNWTWIVVLLTSSSGVASSSSAAAERPNIVLVLADDLGWSDLACYGADLHETPELDRLASEGLRFTRAYAAAPVCTPTRAAILTGKHPARLHMTIWSEGALQYPTQRKLLPAASLPNLPLTERTLADRLHSAGYVTALVGKWHLGNADHAPETHGFDINIGGTHWGAPQTFFWPYRGAGRFGAEFRYVPHLEWGKPGEYLTDRLTDEALEVIDHAVADQRPFFLMLAHHAPHTPIEAHAEDVAYFEQRLTPEMHHRHPTYAAMVRSLDTSVGRIMNKLRDYGIDRDTLVIFSSDNGGYIGSAPFKGQSLPVTDNWPLRSGKASLYEGGLRVPLIIRGFQVTEPGRTIEQPVVLTDLLPTILASTGVALAAEDTCDGISLQPLLARSTGVLPDRPLFFHYPHYYHAPATTPCGAMRTADHWKVIEYFEDERCELFNLANDPAEQHDLAQQMPERLAELRQQLHAWRGSVQANMPEVNPGK